MAERERIAGLADTWVSGITFGPFETDARMDDVRQIARKAYIAGADALLADRAGVTGANSSHDHGNCALCDYIEAQLATASARVQALEGALRTLEWTADADGWPCCPECRREKQRHVDPSSHEPDCALAALLARPGA